MIEAIHSPGLDPAAYIDPAIAAQEDARLFARAWMFVGFEDALARPNDFLTTRIAGQPVVVQNMGGTVKAFANICSHRFATLQTDTGGQRPLVCPYHGWSYDHNGVPKGIPCAEEFGLDAADKAARALACYATEAVGRFRFVRLSATGPDLRTWLGPVAELLEHLSALFTLPVDNARLPWATNWKIGVESVLEVYHVTTVHPQTFKPFTRDGWDIEPLGENASGGRSYLSAASEKWWDGVAKKMDLASSSRFTDYDHFTIWPNMAIGLTRGNLMSVQTYDPVSPTDCTLHYRLFMAAPRKQVPAAVMKAVTDNAITFNKQVLEEDRIVSEAVQGNLAHVSGPATIGRHEGRIVHFHDFWRRMMAEGSP